LRGALRCSLRVQLCAVIGNMCGVYSSMAYSTICMEDVYFV